MCLKNTLIFDSITTPHTIPCLELNYSKLAHTKTASIDAVFVW